MPSSRKKKYSKKNMPLPEKKKKKKKERGPGSFLKKQKRPPTERRNQLCQKTEIEGKKKTASENAGGGGVGSTGSHHARETGNISPREKEKAIEFHKYLRTRWAKGGHPGGLKIPWDAPRKKGKNGRLQNKVLFQKKKPPAPGTPFKRVMGGRREARGAIKEPPTLTTIHCRPKWTKGGPTPALWGWFRGGKGRQKGGGNFKKRGKEKKRGIADKRKK